MTTLVDVGAHVPATRVPIRDLADELGLGRTSVCARVSAVRAERADNRTPDTDVVLLAV